MESKKVIYSVQGEGRGHAGRSLHLMKKMQTDGYKIWVFSGGDAIPILKTSYTVFPVPVFRLYYGKNGISMFATFFKNSVQALGLIFGMGRKYHRILKQVQAIKPVFIISDFEPYLVRIGHRLKIPIISIDHQRVLLDSEMPRMNWMIQYIKLPIYRFIIRILFAQPDKAIVSSFYHFPMKKSSHASFVGPFIPNALYQKTPVQGDHITVYLKESQYFRLLLPTLASMQDIHFDIFSDWKKPVITITTPAHIRLFPIDRNRFLNSLGTSMALLTTAGNQVIGEAVFLKKPVLAFPKLNDTEQKINALALRISGFGACCDLSHINPKIIQDFIDRLSFFRNNITGTIQHPVSYDGTTATLKIVNTCARQFEHNRTEARHLYSHFLRWIKNRICVQAVMRWNWPRQIGSLSESLQKS